MTTSSLSSSSCVAFPGIVFEHSTSSSSVYVRIVSHMVLFPPGNGAIEGQEVLFLWARVMIISTPGSVDTRPRQHSLSLDATLTIAGKRVDESTVSVLTYSGRHSEFFLVRTHTAVFEGHPSV